MLLEYIDRQSAPPHQTGSSFLFGKLQCRFSNPNGKELQLWKINMDFGILNLILMDAKLDFNAFHCDFRVKLVFY